MFKLLGLIIRVTFFVLIILILGNWIQWDGKTISDQIKTQMSQAERSSVTGTVRDWAKKMTYNAKSRIHLKLPNQNDDSDENEISQSERQKLRSLIQELNRTKK